MGKFNAVYLRKSSIANSEEMRRFNTQVTELTNTVKKLDEPFEIFNDEEASSRNELRIEYVKMKEAVEAKKVKAVYVIDDSRLTRDDAEALQFYAMLKKNKVKLYTLLHGEVNLTDKQSAMVSKIKAIFNSFEYDSTVTKIEEGKLRSIKAGVFTGRVPFGYERCKDTKKLIPTEDAKIVVRIFHRYKNGYTLRQIVEELNETSEGWHVGKVSRILRSRTYLGEISYKSTFLEEEEFNGNSHEALIDLELFMEVQAILKNRNYAPNDGKKGERTVGLVNNPLHRLVYCRECGNRRGTSSSPSRPHRTYYKKCEHCGDSGASSVTLFNRLLEDIDNLILELQELLHGLQDDDTLIDKHDERLQEVVTGLTEKQEERKSVIRMNMKKQITEDEFDSYMNELNQDISKLEAEKMELEEITKAKTVEDRVFEIEDNIRKLNLIRSSETPIEEKNRYLRGLLKGIYFKRNTAFKVPSVYVVWNI